MTHEENDGAPRIELSRRGFLSALAVGGVLSLGVELGCGGARATMIRHAEQTGDLAPNLYVTIKRDGRIGVEVDKAEMGQGVTTLFATLVAEELDVAIESIDLRLADSLAGYRTSANMQLTGGSSSTKERFLPLRRASAAAREMLVAAAASEWAVAARDCVTLEGSVVHRETGRKLGYGVLTKLAARLEIPGAPHLKEPRDFKLIGKRNTRVDIRSKVDGSARFGADLAIPNMVQAYVIHGPVFGAQATHVKSDAARARPGILDVFAFEGGVAIVAEKYWQARAAAADVEVTWTAGDVAGLDTEKLGAAVRAYTDDGDAVRDDGHAEDAIDTCAIRVEAIYEAPYLAHAPMEPQNCTVHVTEGHVEVWAPCQSPSLVQAFIAHALGISQSDIVVHSTLCGGAFGRRIVPDFAVQAALIAKRVKRPVRMLWTRESDMTQAFYRPQLAAKMRGGVDGDGHVVGVSAHIVGQSILFSFAPALRAALAGVPSAIQSVLIDALKGLLATDTVPDMFATEGIRDTSYALDNFRLALSPVTTKLPVGMWRSVGHSFNGFAMESFVDELAHAAKIDPLAMRHEMLPPESRARKVVDAVARLSKWGTPRAPGTGRGLARHTSFESEVAEVAEVEIVNGRIKVRRVYAVVACGMVVNPDIVRAQVEGAIVFGLSAALDQEITLENGVVRQTNFDTFPALRIHECPEIIVEIMESDDPPTGIGEPGLPPIGPAVANAIFDLTRVRLRRMPLQRAWNEARK